MSINNIVKIISASIMILAMIVLFVIVFKNILAIICFVIAILSGLILVFFDWILTLFKR